MLIYKESQVQEKVTVSLVMTLEVKVLHQFILLKSKHFQQYKSKRLVQIVVKIVGLRRKIAEKMLELFNATTFHLC